MAHHCIFYQGNRKMCDIGRFNTLNILEVGDHGVIIDGGQWGRLTLSRQQCPKSPAPGDKIDVFLYLDAQGDPVPTTLRPAAELGQVAWLRVVDVTRLGAFVDWGLTKDLFIPFAEQQHPLEKGGHTLVRVYLDKQGRLAGSTCIDRWINDDAKNLTQGEKVSLVIADKTALGFKAVINHECWGLLYANELYRSIRKGQVMDGYIKQIREDGKIDLSVHQPGFSKGRMDNLSKVILTALDDNDGFLALTDKSPPPEIYATFGVSKKVFKQAIGALYKQRRISLEDTGIRLL
jgi:predicted RNA-binding protein (virulence factor B family)